MLVVAIDLPFPISVNQAWRMGRSRRTGKRIMYRSKPYMAWLKQADLQWLTQKPPGLFKTIEVPFKAHLKLSRPDRRRRDVDNVHKGVIDWAQRAKIIKDDCLLQEIRVGWVTDEEAPSGARLIISC